MKTKHLIIICTLIMASFSAWSESDIVFVHYVSDHPPSFWITNKTDKALSISLSKVEVKSDSGWRSYSLPGDPGQSDASFQTDLGALFFMQLQRNDVWLGPHEAGYGNMREGYVTLPTAGTWRAILIVKEQLTGQSRTNFCEVSLP
jgi:hypothetical protein